MHTMSGRSPDVVSARAAVLERFGSPVTLQEFEVPHPQGEEIVVRCTFGGICGTDLHLQQGHLKIPTPIVLGHEGLGTVVELGPNINRDANGAALRSGDTVMWASSIACGRCVPCRMHREPTLCDGRKTYGVNRTVREGPALSGSWAEYIFLREGTTVVKLPQHVDPVAAMAFACAGPTMVHALHERRPVKLGDTVIVQGSGPVGLAAAALAQLSGASRVIVLGGPAGRLERAAAAGIGDFHINVMDVPDRTMRLDEARELCGGRGADLIIECTGVPSAIDEGLSLVRRGGAYIVVGQYTDAGPALINPHQIVYRQLDVVGSWAFSGAHLVEYVNLLPQLTARFDLKSLVTAFPLDDVNRAMEAVKEGTVIKAVLAAN